MKKQTGIFVDAHVLTRGSTHASRVILRFLPTRYVAGNPVVAVLRCFVVLPQGPTQADKWSK